MSGSFYSLNSKYNSLLAQLADIQSGGLPPPPNQNLSSVLTTGNNAASQNIINLGSVQLKAGSGGAITFQDGTSQNTAFTGVAPTPNLASVLAVGSDAASGSITGLVGIQSPSGTPLSLVGLNGQDINIVAFPQGINPSGTINIQTYDGVANQLFSFDGLSLDIPATGSLSWGGGSKIEEVSGDLELGGGGGNVIIDGDLVLANGAGGSLVFQDGTIQNTAFTGASVPTINSVLTSGNDALGLSITGLNDIQISTINGSVYPPATPDLNMVLFAGGNANFQAINNLSSIATVVAGVATRVSQLLPSQLLLLYEDAIYKSFIQGLNPTTSASPPTLTLYGENKSTGDINTTIILPDELSYTGGSIYAITTTGNSIRLSASASSWFFTPSGSITFPDSSTQLTAYTGVPSLNDVLSSDNDAMGSSMINVNDIALNTINGSAYPPASGTIADVLSTGNDAGGLNIINVANISFPSNKVSLGSGAGTFANQSVCIGLNAGTDCFNAICIGNSAGSVGLGNNSVAIGTNASPTNGAANSICIVGDGLTLNPTTSGLFISPIRNGTTTEALYYDTATNEITYGTAALPVIIPVIQLCKEQNPAPVSYTPINGGGYTGFVIQQNFGSLSWSGQVNTQGFIQLRYNLTIQLGDSGDPIIGGTQPNIYTDSGVLYINPTYLITSFTGYDNFPALGIVFQNRIQETILGTALNTWNSLITQLYISYNTLNPNILQFYYINNNTDAYNGSAEQNIQPATTTTFTAELVSGEAGYTSTTLTKIDTQVIL